MQSRSTQALYAYWNEIRGDRVAPRRLEIEPARIGGILHETFVLERPGPHDYRFRLAGTAICEAFGCELRGTSFLDGWDQDDSGEIDRALSQSLRLGAAVLLELEASPADASCAPSFEALLLPLYHVQPEANRLIGTLARLSPDEWDCPRLVAKRLHRLELIWPDGRPRAAIDPLNRQAPFLPEIRHARIVRANRRQFRVYDGGRSGEPPDR